MFSKLRQFKNYETATWIIANISLVFCLNFGWWGIEIIFLWQTKHTALSPCHMTMFSGLEHVTTSSRDTSWTRHTCSAPQYEETAPVLSGMTQRLYATLRRSLFKQSDIVRSLMNCIINNQEIFKQIHLYRILIQGISTIFIHQMPPTLFSNKYILCWHINFQQFATQSDNPQEWQG
jgi:hypothetical protein